MTKRKKFYYSITRRAEEEITTGQKTRNSIIAEDETRNVLNEVKKIAKEKMERAKRNKQMGIFANEKASNIIKVNTKIIEIAEDRLSTY